MRDAILVGVLTAAILGVAQADVVRTVEGGRLIGEILDEESDSLQVTIRTLGGPISIPRADIKSMERSEPQPRDYESRKKAAGDTPKEQYDLALWCLANDLSKEYQAHLARVVELDPEHEAARKRLGFVKVDGEWLSGDEAKAAQGLVKYRGKWVLPEERAQDEADRSANKRKTELHRIIRTAQRSLHHEDRPERVAGARKELLAIKEPIAVPVLVQLLGKKGTASDQRLLVDALAGFEGDESTTALVERGLADENAENRSAVMDALIPRKTPPLVARLMGELKSSENARVRRSAAILGALGDRVAVPALVDALNTEHQRVIEPTMQDYTDALGGVSVRTKETVILPNGTIVRRNLLAGTTADQAFATRVPKRQVIVEEHRNEEVLDALIALTGENWGFDESAWRRWLSEEYRDAAANRDG